MPIYKKLLRTSLCVALLIFSNFTTSASQMGPFNALMSAVQGARSGEPVLPTPTLSLSASTESALIGAAFTLSWSSTHATNCSASGSWSGDKSTSGSETISGEVAGSNTYELTCLGVRGEHSASVSVEITGPVAALWDYTDIAYGTEDPSRQWLNIRLAYDQTEPSPVYLFAHGNGGSANGMSRKQLHTIASEGYTTVSWESIVTLEGEADLLTAVADAQVMFDWVLANAATYNMDPDHIVVGGRSRGSIISWQLAHSNHPSIEGIYMYNALPRGAWQGEDWTPDDDVNPNSPIAYLVYGPDFDDDDGHNPTYADPVIARYDELDIGTRMTRYVDMWGDFQNEQGNWINDGELMHYFPEFVATLQGSATPPVIASNSLFIGHSFFAPIARQMPFHAAQLERNDYTQHVEQSGGETGTPLALWQDEEHRENIQAVLDTGDVEVFGMTFGPNGGYELWIDYALSKNPNTRFVIGIPWIDFPADYDTATYGNTYSEGLEAVWMGFGALQASYPDVDITFMPYGLAAVELRYLFEAGQLPGITQLIGDNPETSLFKDAKGHGHAGGLLLDLAEFIWLKAIFGIDLESYNYDAGHGIDLKEIAQTIVSDYGYYFE